jgi:hypothetical protein
LNLLSSHNLWDHLPHFLLSEQLSLFFVVSSVLMTNLDEEEEEVEEEEKA